MDGDRKDLPLAEGHAVCQVRAAVVCYVKVSSLVTAGAEYTVYLCNDDFGWFRKACWLVLPIARRRRLLNFLFGVTVALHLCPHAWLHSTESVYVELYVVRIIT